MLGQRTLLINPPLINGVAFTRQGRCQERDDVLGTTKPPYTLALMAAMLRNDGMDVRLIDATAERISIDDVISRLDATGFLPTLIVFPSTTPTLDADVIAVGHLKARYKAPMFCFGPHASTVPDLAMARVPDVDGMFVGEPEEGLAQLAGLGSLAEAGAVPNLTWRNAVGAVVAHRAHGNYGRFLDMPYPAWDLVPLKNYSLPLVDKPYVIIETSRGCPYSCDFCVAPIHQGHKFRERSAKTLVDEIERTYREHGIEYFYLWGDTVTLNVKSFSAFCDELIARKLPIQWFGNARADNLTDPAFVHRLRRAGCWMLALGIETESEEVRKDMVKRLESQKIEAAFRNMRDAGIKSFAFFIFGYPGETLETMNQTVNYAVRAGSGLRQLLSGRAISRHGDVRQGRQGRTAATGCGCGLVEDGVLVLPDERQRPEQQGRDGRDPACEAALLPASWLSHAPPRRRRAPGTFEARNLRAGDVTDLVRRQGGRHRPAGGAQERAGVPR